jgi:hypothetical protein
MELVPNWLIERLQWIYSFIVGTLHLPSYVGYGVGIALVAIFFYDLYDLYQNRNKGEWAGIWLAVVLLIPLGTLLYLFLGRPMLHAKANVKRPPVRSASTTQRRGPTGTQTATAIGSVVGAIAMVVGAVAVVIFIIVVIALVQCANDPKCM